jgi:omega-amidase
MSSLNITLIQTDLHWENKSANLDMLNRQFSSLNEPGHIVVLPEMFTTGFSMCPSGLAETMQGNTIEWMKALSKEKKCILTGSVIIKEDNSDNETQYFNRLIWMMPNGNFGYYDKRHLFAFAEEDRFYSRGEKRTIFSVNGWRILPQICYDLRFPVWSRQQLIRADDTCTPEYDVLLYVANWPAKRKHAWRSLLIARAIENQSYVVAVNRIGVDGNNNTYSGNSMVVDPLGEIIFEQENTACMEQITLSKTHLENCRNKFAFLRDADEFRLFRD